MLEMASRVSNVAIKPDAEKQPMRFGLIEHLVLVFYPSRFLFWTILPALAQQRGIIDCGDDMDKSCAEKHHSDGNVNRMPERHHPARRGEGINLSAQHAPALNHFFQLVNLGTRGSIQTLFSFAPLQAVAPIGKHPAKDQRNLGSGFIRGG